MVFTEACMAHDSGLMIPLCQRNLWPKSRTLSSCNWENFIRTPDGMAMAPLGRRCSRQEFFIFRCRQFTFMADF
jgi:hypothetical protein